MKKKKKILNTIMYFSMFMAFVAILFFYVVLNNKTTNKLSSNNYLTDIKIEGYEIPFNEITTEYELKVLDNVTSLKIDTVKSDETSNVLITGNSRLTDGKNKIVISVTAENGTVRDYVINVTREDSESVSLELQLDTLLIQGYDINFDKDVYEYNIKVSNDTTELKIDAASLHDKYKIEIKNNSNFVEGENKVIISLTYKGIEKDYIIKVIKDSKKIDE